MRRTLLLLLLLCALQPLSAWGPQGHKMLASCALLDLPSDLARWYEGYEALLPQHANDPDHWKVRDPREHARHFLDTENYGTPAQVPHDEAQARALLGPALFQASGQVPWVVLERVQRLARTFARGVPREVALNSSWLSHYVGDLNVPLHTTSHHDGATPAQAGLHVRWEDDLLLRLVTGEHWRPEVRPAVLGPHPLEAPWDWLDQSFGLVEGLLLDDLDAQQTSIQSGQGPFGYLYWEVFLTRQGPRVKEQLTVAAQRTAQMMVLAWTLAGRPPAPRD